MKKLEPKTIILYFFITIYILFSVLLEHKSEYNLLNIVITPLFWILLSLFAYYINRETFKRIKFQTTKIQTIFIIVTMYLIFYFLLGLFLGYNKSIYDRSFLGIVKNIWTYIIPIIFMEYTRETIVRNNKGNLNYILVILLFTIANLNIYSLINQTNYSTIFKNISSIVIPTLTSNILLTYLSKTCGYYGNLFYKIPQSLITIILPILPSLDWYYTSILGILLPIFIYIFTKNINDKIENRDSKRRLKKQSIYKLLYVIIPLIILICFVAGVFKYKPTAILSNSMKPKFSRGDVVVIEKINKKSLNKLKKYDIIEYILDGSIVAHRIINIEEHNDGTKLYTTMGDNNNAPDTKKVESKQIIGKVKFKIPKIGYPSVYLNEFFNKNKKANIETGK